MSDDCGKGYALDESGDHVAQHDGVQHVAEVEKWSESGAEEHEHSARQNAANVRDDTETRNADQRRQILWSQQKLHGFKRHHTKGIEFLGHLHGPDLSRECGTRPSADGDGGEQWAEFAREADGNQIDDVVNGSKS